MEDIWNYLDPPWGTVGLSGAQNCNMILASNAASSLQWKIGRGMAAEPDHHVLEARVGPRVPQNPFHSLRLGLYECFHLLLFGIPRCKSWWKIFNWSH